MPTEVFSPEILTAILALLAVGGIAGLLAGLLGVGGGAVLVPAYTIVLEAGGFDGPDMMQLCLATSLASIIVTSLRSVMAHHRRGAVEWEVLRSWAPWIAAGAILGVWLVSRLHTRELRLIFGALVLVVALYTAFSRADWKLSDQMPRGVRRVGLASGLGLVSVLLGIGGGSIGVPMLTLHGRPVHRAVATAAGFGATIALPSVLVFLLVPVADAPPGTVGSVNLPFFLITIAATLVTAPLGARLAHRTDPARLRLIFVLFLIVVAVNMLRKALF